MNEVGFQGCGRIVGEQVQTELGHTEMYLVEARSTGGLSGSPEFVRPTCGYEIKRSDGFRPTAFVAGTINLKRLKAVP